MLNITPSAEQFSWSVDSLFEIPQADAPQANLQHPKRALDDPALLVLKAEMRRELRLEIEHIRATLREEFYTLVQQYTAMIEDNNRRAPLPMPMR